MKTRAQYRAYDPLSGEHRPSKYFEVLREVDAHLEELDGLRVRVEAVRALHARRGQRFGFCESCDTDWPCPTIKALDGQP